MSMVDRLGHPAAAGETVSYDWVRLSDVDSTDISLSCKRLICPLQLIRRPCMFT